MKENKKVMLSGVKPTGSPHVGNYFGAMKSFVDLQDLNNELYVFVANYHALISLHDKDLLEMYTINLVKDYIAIGLNPEKATIFLQSDVKTHTELNWIFNCLVTVPFMERSHAYKDSISNGKEATVGLFDYPVLMAADILLYSPDIVPVGSDQKQHIEYTRDIAGKFNSVFGETFKLPVEYISQGAGIVPGIDGRKMSKSYNNHIPLFASDEEIINLCMKIVTDSKGVDEKKTSEDNNIFNIYKFFANKEELNIFKKKLEDGGVGYGQLKKELAEKIISFIKPMREKRESISDEYVKLILKQGAIKANQIAEEKMIEVRNKTGILTSI